MSSLIPISSLRKVYCFCATCGKKILFSHSEKEEKAVPTNYMCRTCESKLIDVTIEGFTCRIPSDMDPLRLLSLLGKDPAHWKVIEGFQLMEVSPIEKLSDRVTQDAQCDVCQAFLPTGPAFYYETEEENLVDLCEKCVKSRNGYDLYRFRNVSCGFTDLWSDDKAEANKIPPSIYSDLNRIISGLFEIGVKNADDIHIWMGEKSLLINPDTIDGLHDNLEETRQSIICLLERLNRSWFPVSRRLNILIQCMRRKQLLPLLPCFVQIETIERRNPVEEYKQELLNDRKRSRERKEQLEKVEYTIPGSFMNDSVHAFERGEMRRKIII